MVLNKERNTMTELLEEARTIMKRRATTSHAMSFTQLARNKHWKTDLEERGFIEVTTHDGLAGYFISPDLAQTYAQQSEEAEYAEDAQFVQSLIDQYGPLDNLNWTSGEEGAEQAIALLGRAETAVHDALREQD